MKIYTVLIIGLLFSAYSNGQTKIAINELHSSGHLITEKQIDLIFDFVQSDRVYLKNH